MRHTKLQYGVAIILWLSWSVSPTMAADTPKLSLDVSMATTQLPAERPNRTYLKIGLTGFPLQVAEHRPTVNVALILDKSASMQGEKLEKAKQAAVAAVDRLQADDIVSVIAYHDGVQVVLPASKLRDKSAAKGAIRSITAGGSTALFAGISKGAAEVRKYVDDYRVNRILLLSDGRANVGPDSPHEMGELAASLLKENIGVTTLGLGLDFNEDLMTQLAMRSNGNYFVAESADDLLPTFHHEFDDILSVVAQRVLIDVDIPDQIRPIRVLGHDAEIHGQHVVLQMNQIYAEQERFVLVEVETEAMADGAAKRIANVGVQYVNMANHAVERLVQSAQVEFVRNPSTLAVNAEVAEKIALLLANENNRLAARLRDQGKVDEARRLLVSNYDFLTRKANELNSPLLTQQRLLNQVQARSLDTDWKRTRKLMLRDSTAVAQQASGYGGGSSMPSRGSKQAQGSAYGGGYSKTKSVAEPFDHGDSQLIKLPHEPETQQDQVDERQSKDGFGAPVQGRQRTK